MEALEVLQGCIKGVQLLAAGMVFAGLAYVGATAGTGRLVLQAYETICMHAKQSGRGLFDYGRWEQYLQKYGAVYYYGSWINPVSYLAVCFMAGLMGLAIGLSGGLAAGVVLSLIGIFLPGILLQYLNKRDNERMMWELDMVYSALAIQIRAGVYVTDALAECYGSVSHVRLRDALQNLSGDIVMKADLDSALDRFQSRFNNQYIDSLCITILQATESGQAVELLGDIAEQIKDMEITLQHKKKEQLNRSATFYQLGIFALILVLVLYACVVHLFSASLFFS
ncbi:MAG: type II secretion system F family protein [Lachnospiraceae bacterium]|nr:type II secretion system F family protein [Lachnospiraceae bacterium]